MVKCTGFRSRGADLESASSLSSSVTLDLGCPGSRKLRQAFHGKWSIWEGILPEGMKLHLTGELWSLRRIHFRVVPTEEADVLSVF